MLMRSRRMVLKSGANIETPLLIPSLSSKGFAFRPDGRSEVATYLELAKDELTEALLLSAYDIEHRYLPDVTELLSDDHWSTVYSNTRLLVIDSGGYELNSGWQAGDLVRGAWRPRSFDAEAYGRIVDRLPTDFDLLVVNYDHVEPPTQRVDYPQQVESSARFFETRKHLMNNLLLRPPADKHYLDPHAVRPVIPSLTQFDVVGVTEKEAGDSLLDRLTTIARLRYMLDQAEVDVPIHVFGVLDPLLVTLYFMAGAEIFDGLTWLRFGHYNGLSIYRETVPVLENHVDMSASVRGARSQLTYLEALRDLKRTLRSWESSGGNDACLRYHHLTVKNVRDRLELAIGLEI